MLDPGPDGSSSRRRAALGAAATAAAVLAVVGGLGTASPMALTLVGTAVFDALVALARARVHAGPPPAARDAVLAAGLGLSLATAFLLGGLAADLTGDALLRRMGRGWAMIAAALGVVVFRGVLPPRVQCGVVSLLGGGAAQGDDRSLTVPVRHPLALAIVPLGLVFHAVFFFAYPPLIQTDSYVNLMEPPLFTEAEHFFHHPPIYVLLVKAFGSGPRFLVGLQALVALQHALVVCLALGVERVTRLETESPLAAALAGIFIACDPHLALYAQLVLTEVVAISFALGGVVLLFEAARRERADRWLFAAGASAALATLTRQAFEFWPFVAAAWLLAAGPVRPRRRAAAIFFVAAYLPLLPFVLHNHVFFGRPALTAATGRNLVYRVCEGLPDLTDAKAPPGDELERARRRIHENRDRLWKGAYDAVAADLGWSDDRIDAAVQRFYFEQVFKYPAEFTRVTVAYVCQLLVATETIGSILELHNLTRPVASQPWDLLPHAEPAPAWLEAVNGAEPTSAPSFLMFAAVAPLLARGRARRLALLAVASVGYVVVLTSLVELPVFRYRLPAVPFMVLACAAAATGLVAHLRAMGGRR